MLVPKNTGPVFSGSPWQGGTVQIMGRFQGGTWEEWIARKMDEIYPTEAVNAPQFVKRFEPPLQKKTKTFSIQNKSHSLGLYKG